MSLAAKIASLKDKLFEIFEEKSNKVTSWSATTSNDKYPSEKLVKDSLDSKQDVSNKVTSWSSTTSNDNYPSEKLVKDTLDAKEISANKVTSWSATPSDTNYPSEKLVADALDTKLESSDLPTKTSDLENDGDGENPFLTEHQSLESTIVDVEKQTTADTGYSATYVVKQNGSQVGSKINIPKDFLVKSGQVKTVSTADDPVTGYTVGDKYIDFVINSKDGSSTDEHMYILVSDLVEDTTYTADGTTLTLSNGEFSVADSGINTTQLADDAVTSDKIADSAVGSNAIASNAVTTAKILDCAVTADKIDSTITSDWLTSADVDGQIEDSIDSLIAALTPSP